MPKVMIRSFKNLKAIVPYGSEQLTIDGKALSVSGLAQSLPILSMSLTNNSIQTVKVMLNGDENNSFYVPASGTQGISGYPITDIRLGNQGAVNIGVGELTVILMNDQTECLRYIQAVKAGVMPYAN
jgi:hypothetical protein